ncbi:unnamed protein product [Protopolystoma xenopodis]|uniref:Neutral ceramidase n=1 Tax=Protopolystoma xenopodis TaxID=117903 RepID=A0A3S4ZS92_9PLAT|nr:unnamed protein product [Protopolystoma xenopodis]
MRYFACLLFYFISMLLLLLLLIAPACSYYIGVGIGDITGPAAEVNMMGYANPDQTDSGIHLRLYSRAFIIKENQFSKPIAFVSLDAGMTSQLVKFEVVNRLKTLFNATYDHSNVMLSSTHTHSGPAGYFQYLLFTITSMGFVGQSYEALVEGIVKKLQSIYQAHFNVKEGKILYSKGDLYNASINRSPASYMLNPEEERAKYILFVLTFRYKTDVDKEMLLLKFVDSKGNPMGMINWFAVHGVSMNSSNLLISSDNKGVASILFESAMNKKPILGKGPFVAAFAQSNEGDVSPNIKGPVCIDTGKPCDYVRSTCDGKSQKCIAFGPGKDMFESTMIIGKQQFKKALELFDAATDEVSGQVSSIHQYVDMTNVNVQYKEGRKGSTCKPAMGFSFAAGTVDGPGAFDFSQGGFFFWPKLLNYMSISFS